MTRREDNQPFVADVGGYVDMSPYDRRLQKDELLREAKQARKESRSRAIRQHWWEFWRRPPES